MHHPAKPLPHSDDTPTVASQPTFAQPGPNLSSPTQRSHYLLGCIFLWLLPLVVITGITSGIFLAASQSGRLNVLVLGSDRRPDETGPVRTDTLILTTFDPSKPHTALLSIPRDLWVEIPGQGSNRINTANYFGELSQPGYGPNLAVQTITNNFGIPTHNYVRLDFTGFVSLINALGGIEIEVPQTIIDDRYPTPDYGFTTIVIPAGPQHMDGETALIYARTRHVDSDFGRNKRQQQILRALVTKAVQPATWPRLPTVWAVARANLDTDLTEVDLATIFLSVMLVGPEGLEMHAIDQQMTQPFVTSDGAQVLLPRWEVIWPAVNKIF